jgi:hypothetical protein
MQTSLPPIIAALLGYRGLLLSMLLIILIVVKEFVQAAGGRRAHLWSILLAAAIVPLLVAFGLTVALRLGDGGRPVRAALTATQEHHS